MGEYNMIEKMKILIVDDEEIIRENLVDYFEDEGIEAVGYENGESALKELQKGYYHYAIVDLRLPGMDGNHFVKKAKEIDEELKFIIHTGSSDYMLPGDLKELGMSDRDVFFKPIIDMGILLNYIRKKTSDFN